MVCRCQVAPSRPGSPGMSSCPCLLSCSLPLPSPDHDVPSSSDNCLSRSPKVPTSLGFILITLFFLSILYPCVLSLTPTVLWGRLILMAWLSGHGRCHTLISHHGFSTWIHNIPKVAPSIITANNTFIKPLSLKPESKDSTTDSQCPATQQPFTKSNGISC